MDLRPYQPPLSGAVAGIGRFGHKSRPPFADAFVGRETANASAQQALVRSANSARLALQRRSYARVPAAYDQSLIGRNSLHSTTFACALLVISLLSQRQLHITKWCFWCISSASLPQQSKYLILYRHLRHSMIDDSLRFFDL